MNLFQLYLDAAALPDANAQQHFIESLAQKSAQLAEKLSALLADNSNTLHLTDEIRYAASRLQQLDISAGLTGQRLGYWQLDRIIAHGGMSTVYLASRQDGQFEQQVAIKVLNPLIYPVTADSKAFAEANVAARLNHPGITKVFDAGITDHQGQQAHYIVMEFIKGQPLNQWLASTKPKMKPVVQLFIELCDALHYAHTHQIIHADVKPENILVDEHGKPKLIDFGIARLQQQDEATPVFVQHYVKALSRHYASPEQLKGEPLTTLSDVYSVGKVLQQMLRSIDVKPAQELVAVITMACEISTEKRYNAILALQQDLTAFITHRPLQACKGGAFYSFKKLVQRQPILLGSVSLLFIALAGFSISLQQKNLALVTERSIAEQVSQFMVEVFNAADPMLYDGNPISAGELLQDATTKLNALPVEAEVTQRLKLQLAASLRGIGAADKALAVLQFNPLSKLKADFALEKSIALINDGQDQAALDALATLQPGSMNDRQRLLYFYYFGRGSIVLSQHQQAAESLQQAEQLALKLADHTLLQNIYNGQVYNLQLQGKTQEQLAIAKRAIAQAEQSLNSESNARVMALNTLQSAYAAAEDYHQAMAVLEEMLALQQKLLPADHPAIALTLNELGHNHSSLQQYQQAIDYHNKALAIIEQRFGSRHIDYIFGNAYLGNAYAYLKQFEPAIEAYSRSLHASEQLYGDINLTTITARSNLAGAYYESKQPETALPIIEQAMADIKTLYDDDSVRVALLKIVYAGVLIDLNQQQAGINLLEQSLLVLGQTLGENHIRYQNVQRRLLELAGEDAKSGT
ncbi:serine/threonine-protein kinase [Alkalimonas sp.]|uniref:serine/threonine-protein kinase n=1 Tax=Alkalimonas sp. TaxID=1872453 RepID=UPI00263A7239|nr:serine/threonine-protein kinase [Alkalimonas sp.]MCC5827403.1 serine/threonine protein kinase [Alkalimonas sp.]